MTTSVPGKLHAPLHTLEFPAGQTEACISFQFASDEEAGLQVEVVGEDEEVTTFTYRAYDLNTPIDAQIGIQNSTKRYRIVESLYTTTDTNRAESYDICFKCFT